MARIHRKDYQKISLWKESPRHLLRIPSRIQLSTDEYMHGRKLLKDIKIIAEPGRGNQPPSLTKGQKFCLLSPTILANLIFHEVSGRIFRRSCLSDREELSLD